MGHFSQKFTFNWGKKRKKVAVPTEHWWARETPFTPVLCGLWALIRERRSEARSSPRFNPGKGAIRDTARERATERERKRKACLTFLVIYLACHQWAVTLNSTHAVSPLRATTKPNCSWPASLSSTRKLSGKEKSLCIYKLSCVVTTTRFLFWYQS